MHCQDGKKTASVKICSQIQDNDHFVDENGQRSSWKDFKDRHPEWDFSNHFDEEDERLKHESRSLASWKKIGPNFCDKYGMQFTSLGEQGSVSSTIPMHYLLILDKSGSMGGFLFGRGQIESLKQAVEGLLKKCSGDDLFSVVWFNDTSEISAEFSDESQCRSAIRNIKPCGTTTYVAGLEAGHQVLLTHAKKFQHHRHVLVFMSDGGNNGPDPLPALAKLVEDFPHSFFRKKVFVGFGQKSCFEVLEEMANTVNGEFSTTADAAVLKRVFAEVAQFKEGGVRALET